MHPSDDHNHRDGFDDVKDLFARLRRTVESHSSTLPASVSAERCSHEYDAAVRVASARAELEAIELGDNWNATHLDVCTALLGAATRDLFAAGRP